MRYLLALLLVAALLGLLYWRLRPYIEAARRVLGFVRDVRGLNANDPTPDAPRRARAPSEKLVRCSACGTWLPASRALTPVRSAQIYCSHACLERSAGGGSGRAVGRS